MATATYNIRMDAGLKAQVDEVAREMGITLPSAFNASARQFVAHWGFPFEVVAPVPTEHAFAQEMDDVYAQMRAGAASARDLAED